MLICVLALDAAVIASLFRGQKNDVPQIEKKELFGVWKIQDIPYNVTHTFNDSIFAIDEEYEGCEYYYEVEGNKIYYTQNVNGLDIPPMTDSLIVTNINDSTMVVVWFNPTMKLNERFILKKIK